jgi:L-cysteate sulfo-lyase
MTTDLPRVRLAYLPTPLKPLPRLSKSLGVELWVKRDDQTGLATGGNKTRKLEFLMAEAQAQAADMVVTMGAPQSNHCRQTAAAAARLGLGCVLVLRGEVPRAAWTGNLLLDELLGASVRWSGQRDRLEVAAEVMDELAAGGRAPYLIPYGGSNPVGASAYALAFQELWQQMADQDVSFDRVVFASSSGGTQGGLLVGATACGYGGQVLGISVDKTGGHLRDIVIDLFQPTAARLGWELVLEPGAVAIDDRFLGAGYGIVGEAEREALRLLARTEGLLLDPVYTGKAMAGLLSLIRQGEIKAGERVCFWHTGGTSALFAYTSELLV